MKLLFRLTQFVLAGDKVSVLENKPKGSAQLFVLRKIK